MEEARHIMRKFQKESLLEIIMDLHMLQYEMKEEMEQKNYQAVQTALSDAQTAAIEMGEAIERIEGNGTKAVSCLEAYCEKIYQVNLHIQNITAQKAYKILEEALAEAENAIQHMAVKKTVVFLPYKASMWDSLESVWRVASQDKEWECLVIPIPYFNKNDDGSIGEMEYEGREFPSYVPIVDWRNYALEQEHPDVILIHNPYDQYNFITMVHPYFFASKLKDYTEKLVYIPYFIHQNEVVKEHYCVLPGTLYADAIILQSDRVREQYIKTFEAGLPELVEKLGKDVIEQKFLALGSPKMDILEMNDTGIPDGWKPFLAQGRKVLFFNTHLSGLMKQKSENFLKKLEWVFGFFKNREDVVLLWRPHPLMIETAKSANPEAIEPYLRLVERYRQERIGIYDDSADLRRAVKLADAYYGDSSSVVELFRSQGKPVMIMSHDMREE